MYKFLEFYRGARILITGGSGSIGRAMIDMLTDVADEITIFSRDETLQAETFRMYPGTKGVLGDVRDRFAVEQVCKGKDIVIHAAALKHVDLCELNVTEALEINLLGAINVLESSISNNVRILIGISSDKAASPAGVMGMTKRLQEKLFLSYPERNTKITVSRYGNVLGSRGSVVWKFLEQRNKFEPLTVTDPGMMRFAITPMQAAEVSLFGGAFEFSHGVIWSRVMPYLFIGDLAAAIDPKHRSDVVGFRPGERLIEPLLEPDEYERLQMVETEIGKLLVVHPDKSKATNVKQSDIPDIRLTIPQIQEMLEEIGILL